ncbi:MAG TPA: hypothetical protein VLU24_07560 [Mycobacterium sp.]|nr:hypothetical protein [Mycobacterium sp.]
MLITLAVPADEVFYGVFAANSADIVTKACDRAGLRAERLTNAIDTRIAALS